VRKIWKILILGALLGLITIIILYAIPWGEYESDLEKTELTTTVDTLGGVEESTVSLDKLEGIYIANSENGKSELIFEVDGLKETKGAFEQFTVKFDMQNEYSDSRLEVNIQVNSINTENDYRDEHILDEDFFLESEFPLISYIAEEISFDEDEYTAHGEVTLVGKTTTLDFSFKHLGGGTYEDDGISFEAFEGAFEFDRVEYGMEEDGGVGNVVSITFYCELIKS